jgi:C4-dicarboxylate-specific signal transduction histidine kinase
MNDSEKEMLKQALHEINNALNAMSMQSELAVMYGEKGDNKQLQTVMAGVMKSCRRCSTITHNLQSKLFKIDS